MKDWEQGSDDQVSHQGKYSNRNWNRSIGGKNKTKQNKNKKNVGRESLKKKMK